MLNSTTGRLTMRKRLAPLRIQHIFSSLSDHIDSKTQNPSILGQQCEFRSDIYIAVEFSIWEGIVGHACMQDSRRPNKALPNKISGWYVRGLDLIKHYPTKYPKTPNISSGHPEIPWRCATRDIWFPKGPCIFSQTKQEHMLGGNATSSNSKASQRSNAITYYKCIHM